MPKALFNFFLAIRYGRMSSFSTQKWHVFGVFLLSVAFWVSWPLFLENFVKLFLILGHFLETLGAAAISKIYGRTRKTWSNKVEQGRTIA